MKPCTQKFSFHVNLVTRKDLGSLPRVPLFKITSSSTIFLDPSHVRTQRNSFKKDIKRDKYTWLTTKNALKVTKDIKEPNKLDP